MKILQAMMVPIAAILMGCLWASSGYAGKQDCAEAVSTAEMQTCANRLYQEADAELNQVYRQLIAQLSAQRKTQLKASQQAWITFRDKNTAFAAGIADWPVHLTRMKTFWRSVLHNSGEYSGNPMAKHMAIPGLDEAHFAHWLNLFYATLRDLADSKEAAALVGGRARMIADSLLTGIATRRDGLSGARAGKNQPKLADT